MEINEQKRQKFMENASKRVNNVMHNIQILEPMARSNTYDFTRNDVEEMFTAIQETLDNVKQEFYKKFELKSKSERKAFSFGQSSVQTVNNVTEVSDVVTGESNTVIKESLDEVLDENNVNKEVTENID